MSLARMASKRKASNSPPGSTTRTADVTLNLPPDIADPASSLETQDRHFRELYSKPPDFIGLAQQDPDFAAVTNGRALDFSDPASVLQLSKTLLRLDFGLALELPDDRLCPPIPNRQNYILWLKDLLDTSSYSPPGRALVGIDIGTGASCIYPLLGCAQRPWSFIATENDVESLKWARKNVQLNGLGHRIQVVSRGTGDALIPLDDAGLASADFTMTNPPFYESEDALLKSAKEKRHPPLTACTGSLSEMVVEGGELAFVGRILDESVVLGRRVQWYTTMLGHLASVATLVGKLRNKGIGNYAVTEFVQGKTRRWAVAWSFAPMRPAQPAARGTKVASTKLELLPPQTEVEVARIAIPTAVGELAQRLNRALASLDLLSWEWDAQALAGVGRAPDRVWARAWRRRRKQLQTRTESEPMPEETQSQQEPTCNLGFRVSIHVLTDFVSVRCRWLEGFDAVAFESFQGYMRAQAHGPAS